MDQPNKERRLLSRRDALKALAAAGGAVALATLPNEWVKPVVEVGYLPAHAQASPTPTPTPEPTPGRFRIDLESPVTGQVVSLAQDGTVGTLILQPGSAAPPTCPGPVGFVGNGYTITVEGDRPPGVINVTVTGTAETSDVPGGGCRGVDASGIAGCTATANPVSLQILAADSSINYAATVPWAYRQSPCGWGCGNVVDGLAGTITISDDAGVIPTLTITVMMQGACV